MNSVAFSPDGKRIVSGSDDNTLRVWDADTGQPIGQPLTGHTERVYSVAFSPDGNRIASGSGDDDGAAVGRRHRQPIGAPADRPHRRGVSVAFSPDGHRSPPAATTARCGCGTPPPANPSASR